MKVPDDLDEVTVGLCLGTGIGGKTGVNCWTYYRESADDQFINPRSYFFEELVIKESRASPDIT